MDTELLIFLETAVEKGRNRSATLVLEGSTSRRESSLCDKLLHCIHSFMYIDSGGLND